MVNGRPMGLDWGFRLLNFRYTTLTRPCSELRCCMAGCMALCCGGRSGTRKYGVGRVIEFLVIGCLTLVIYPRYVIRVDGEKPQRVVLGSFGVIEGKPRFIWFRDFTLGSVSLSSCSNSLLLRWE